MFTYPAGMLRRRLLHRNGTFVPPAPPTRTRRQFEILVEGFEPDNPEMKRINTQIQKITQTFILQTKRFLDKPTTPLPPPLVPPNHLLP